MKISYFIFLGFMLILIMFSITTFINFQETEKVNENSEWFAKSTTIARHGNRLQRNFLNMVSGLRGFLLTGENYFLESYDSANMENRGILLELETLIPDTSSQRRSLDEIRTLNSQWVETFATPLVKAKMAASSSDSAQRAFNNLYRDILVTVNEKNINRTLQSRARDFSNYEYDLREIRKNALTDSITKTRIITFYLNTFSIVLGIAIAFFLAYWISSRIIKMVRMSESITSGNYEVRIEDNTNDELSGLAKSLNHLAASLGENIRLLKRKNEELDQFAHIVSHDLKAPLRGIDNVVTWIEEDHTRELSPKMEEYMRLIKGRLTRAENLIKGILSYARVGRELPEPENVDLNQLFSEIQGNTVLPSRMRLEIPPQLPTILTERIPLQQILTNLISNAIKYHDKPDGWIKVGFENKGTHYVFSVADNGPGIARNYHDKIFVIFQTLQERDSFESTGVGLAIVKKILTDRMQHIEVVSDAGKGATFIFTWPVIGPTD